MSSISRASTVLAAGTLISRVTGLIRTIVLVAAIGSVKSRAGDAFAVANQLPNSIFAIISTGILTAVIVPQIVKASRADDGGERFISKLITLATVVLLVVTGIAMVVAPWLVQLYAYAFTPDQQALALAFAYWCLPQIFFYGMYAFLGETLNAKRIFGPFTWAPIVNNVVSIAGFLALILLFGPDRTAVSDWTPGAIAILGGTATLGIVVQAGVLLLFWRRTGLRLRPDFRWRGVGLGNIGRLAGWTFLMVIVGQLAGLVQTMVASMASGEAASVFVMQNAWLIFMLPYSIIVLSIGTPYFTQLSEHAVAGRDDAVRGDIDQSIRALGFLIAVAAAAIAAAAVPASRVFTNSASDAAVAASVLLCYLVGLLPLAVLFIIQRTFYAYGDTRTPFFFTLFQGTVIVVGTIVIGQLAVAGVLPLALLGGAIALMQSVATVLQTIVATWLLHRRLGTVRASAWLPALGRFVLAAIPAGLAGWGVYLLTGGDEGWTTSTTLLGAVGTGVIGLVVLAVYIGVSALMRVPELSVAGSLVQKVLRRGR